MSLGAWPSPCGLGRYWVLLLSLDVLNWHGVGAVDSYSFPHKRVCPSDLGFLFLWYVPPSHLVFVYFPLLLS